VARSLRNSQILYNHIYHSNLNKEYLDKIYQDKRYKDIITHRNFNPRIIEFVTDNIRVGNTIPDDYWEYIKKNLEEPEDIWAEYFQNQTDDCIRALTFLTVFNNGKISEEKLRSSYNTFLKIHTVNLGDSSDKSFEAIRKLATKSLLNRNQIGEKKYEYVLFNPSITDFILSSYSDESELISNILKSLETEASLKYLNTISVFSKINKQCSKKIQENLFKYFFERKMEEEDWDFLILVSYLDFFNENLNKQIELFLNTLINADNPRVKNLSELLSILTDFDPEIEFKDYEFLYNFIEDFLDEDTLIDLLNFIDKFNINDKKILSQVENLIEYYLDDIIKYNDLGIDFGSHINQHSYPNFDINKRGVESDISDTLDSFLKSFNKNVLEKIEFSTSNIISRLDIDDMAMSYLENQDYENDDEMGVNYNTGTSSEDEIDAIFERS